jgi:peptidoglycan/LPS O-acetylase OafA/YrhL
MSSAAGERPVPSRVAHELLSKEACVGSPITSVATTTSEIGRLAGDPPNRDAMRRFSRPTFGSSQRLETALDPRRNSINALRLLFAMMVIGGHAAHVGFGNPSPALGSIALNAIPVDGFFVLSGYLITQSWFTQQRLGGFLLRRVARIFPAYWLCLILTAVGLVPVLAEIEHTSVPLGLHNGVLGYVVTNFLLFIHQHQVGATLQHSNVPNELNGSLWTLFYEFAAYLCVAALGAIGWLATRRRTVVVIACLCYAGLLWYTIDPTGFKTTLHSPYLAGNAARLGLMFSIGVCFRLWQDRVIIDARLAALSLAVFLASAPLPDWHLLGAVAFAYFVFWLAIKLPLTKVGSKHDVSYGVYVYGWPVLQLLAVLHVPTAGPVAYVAAGLAFATALAWFSFVLVERPAMLWARRRTPKAVTSPPPPQPEEVPSVTVNV